MTQGHLGQTENRVFIREKEMTHMTFLLWSYHCDTGNRPFFLRVSIRKCKMCRFETSHDKQLT
jgi:hypothetical protein